MEHSWISEQSMDIDSTLKERVSRRCLALPYQSPLRLEANLGCSTRRSWAPCHTVALYESSSLIRLGIRDTRTVLTLCFVSIKILSPGSRC